MYSECISCEKIGKICDGPNFMAAPVPELFSWCKKRKAFLGLSNGKLAELSGVPKSTIDRIFAPNYERIDIRIETIRPILKALVGGEFKGNPCPEPPGDDSPKATERLAQCEIELKWQQDKIATLKRETEVLLEQIHEKDILLKERAAFLRQKDSYIRILGITSAVCIAAIVAALIVDKLNSDIGFFWIAEALNFMKDSSSMPGGITI